MVTLPAGLHVACILSHEEETPSDIPGWSQTPQISSKQRTGTFVLRFVSIFVNVLYVRTRGVVIWLLNVPLSAFSRFTCSSLENRKRLTSAEGTVAINRVSETRWVTEVGTGASSLPPLYPL